MLDPVRAEESGFTLIELLVVILIIGVLAAIALPTFLGQRKKGDDASAKSDARNLVTQIESCYADTQDYTGCDTAAELGTTGLSIGAGVGQVSISAPGSGPATQGYLIDAHSRSGNHFYMEKDLNGPIVRTCTTTGDGGCPSSGDW